jgi:hypothetical protein
MTRLVSDQSVFITAYVLDKPCRIGEAACQKLSPRRLAAAPFMKAGQNEAVIAPFGTPKFSVIIEKVLRFVT